MFEKSIVKPLKLFVSKGFNTLKREFNSDIWWLDKIIATRYIIDMEKTNAFVFLDC